MDGPTENERFHSHDYSLTAPFDSFSFNLYRHLETLLPPMNIHDRVAHPKSKSQHTKMLFDLAIELGRHQPHAKCPLMDAQKDRTMD